MGKQKIIRTGNTATTRAAAPRTLGGDPSSSEAAAAWRGCCGAAAVAPLQPPPPPRSAARQQQQWRRRPSPLSSASPGRGRTLRRAAALARPRRRHRRCCVHGPRPRRCSPAPAPQSLGASSGSFSSCRGSPALCPRPPLGLPAAARPVSHTRRLGWVPAPPASLRLAPPPLDRPALAALEPGCVPQAPPRPSALHAQPLPLA